MIRSTRPNRPNVIKFRKLALKLRLARSRKEWTKKDELIFLQSFQAISQGISSYDRQLATYSILYTEIVFPISGAYTKKFILDQFTNAFDRMASYLEKAKTKHDVLSGLDAGYVWLAGQTSHLLMWFMAKARHWAETGILRYPPPQMIYDLPVIFRETPILKTISIQDVIFSFVEMRNLMSYIGRSGPKDVVEWQRFYNELINPGTGPLPTRKVLLNILKVFDPSVSQGTKEFTGDVLATMKE